MSRWRLSYGYTTGRQGKLALPPQREGGGKDRGLTKPEREKKPLTCTVRTESAEDARGPPAMQRQPGESGCRAAAAASRVGSH